MRLLTPGQFVGPTHQVTEVLDGSGTTAIYRCRHVLRDGEEVAKVLDEELARLEPVRDAFRAMARQAVALDHPLLVPMRELLLGGELVAHVLPSLRGEALAARLARLRRQPPARAIALDWVAQLARGLATLHARGIAHGELTPARIFLEPAAGGGTPETVRLLDLGIGGLRAALRRAGQTGGEPSCPHYLAPEVLSAAAEPAGPAADVYSLGVLLHELLVGWPPLFGETAEEVLAAFSAHLFAPPPLDPPDAELADGIIACLRARPAARPTVPDLLALVERALARSGDPRPAAVTPAPGPAPAPVPADPRPAASLPADPRPAASLPADPRPAAPVAGRVAEIPLAALPLRPGEAEGPLPTAPRPDPATRSPLPVEPVWRTARRGSWAEASGSGTPEGGVPAGAAPGTSGATAPAQPCAAPAARWTPAPPPPCPTPAPCDERFAAMTTDEEDADDELAEVQTGAQRRRQLSSIGLLLGGVVMAAVAFLYVVTVAVEGGWVEALIERLDVTVPTPRDLVRALSGEEGDGGGTAIVTAGSAATMNDPAAQLLELELAARRAEEDRLRAAALAAAATSGEATPGSVGPASAADPGPAPAADPGPAAVDDAGEPAEEAAPDPGQLELYRKIHAHRAEIDDCYERVRRAQPRLAGTLDLRLRIDGRGRVEVLRAELLPRRDRTLETCVKARALTWRLSPPPQAPVELRVPYSLGQAETE